VYFTLRSPGAGHQRHIERIFASSMPTHSDARAHGPESAHPGRDGPARRASVPSRASPATGGTLLVHRQNPFWHGTTSDAPCPIVVAAAAARCAACRFLIPLSKGGIHHQAIKPLSSFAITPPISQQGVRRAPHLRQQVTPEQLRPCPRGPRFAELAITLTQSTQAG